MKFQKKTISDLLKETGDLLELEDCYPYNVDSVYSSEDCNVDSVYSSEDCNVDSVYSSEDCNSAIYNEPAQWEYLQNQQAEWNTLTFEKAQELVNESQTNYLNLDNNPHQLYTARGLFFRGDARNPEYIFKFGINLYNKNDLTNTYQGSGLKGRITGQVGISSTDDFNVAIRYPNPIEDHNPVYLIDGRSYSSIYDVNANYNQYGDNSNSTTSSSSSLIGLEDESEFNFMSNIDSKDIVGVFAPITRIFICNQNYIGTFWLDYFSSSASENP